MERIKARILGLFAHPRHAAHGMTGDIQKDPKNQVIAEELKRRRTVQKLNEHMLSRRRFLKQTGAAVVAGVGGLILPVRAQASITYAS